jgi:hypothetical protein
VELVLAPLADEPRGTACPSELPPPFELPPRRCWSARSDRGARIGWLGDALFPIQPAPALEDDELPLELDAAGADDEEEDEGEDEADDPPPLSRGTADPTVSPFEERDPACPAQAGESPSVKADAISPTVNF